MRSTRPGCARWMPAGGVCFRAVGVIGGDRVQLWGRGPLRSPGGAARILWFITYMSCYYLLYFAVHSLLLCQY
jgi:hypothetical protein